MELGLKRGTVRIDKYNSEWKNEYLKEEMTAQNANGVCTEVATVAVSLYMVCRVTGKRGFESRSHRPKGNWRLPMREV